MPRGKIPLQSPLIRTFTSFSVCPFSEHEQVEDSDILSTRALNPPGEAVRSLQSMASSPRRTHNYGTHPRRLI